MLTFGKDTFITNDGRVVTLTEPADHELQIEVEGQAIVYFRPSGITITNTLKEVKPIGREN